MDIILNIVASAMLMVLGLFGAADTQLQANTSQASVEIGLSETSPKGVAGGFAVPASGCSDLSHGPIHDCNPVAPIISVDNPIIRLDDPVQVSWDPNTNVNCVLTDNILAVEPAANGNAIGSVQDFPTGETLYGIVCDGAGNESYVRVQVLPRIQET